ncbi:hypothetical protein Tco_1357433 [Tanacetum coccineum]
MDDLNITMEEYIRLQEEKVLSRRETFDWQTTTYSKMEYCKDEDDSFTKFETEYPAIVFDDTSDAALSCESTISPLNENEIDFRISFDESDDEDYMVMGLNGGKPIFLSTDTIQHMSPLPSKDQRHTWLRYQVEGYGEDIVHNYKQRLETICGRSVNRVHILDFAGLTEEMRQTLGDRLRMVYTRDEGQELFISHVWRRLFEISAPLFGGVRQRMTWRQFILALGLHTEEEMVEDGFGAYWPGRLCHMDTRREHAIFLAGGRHLRRHDEGKKRVGKKARLIGVTSLRPQDQRGSRRVRLVPLGAAEDAPAIDEGAQTDLAPEQAS